MGGSGRPPHRTNLSSIRNGLHGAGAASPAATTLIVVAHVADAARRLLNHRDVIVMRCAWHPRYRGYPWIYSIGSWRGRGVAFSDGMCQACARHWCDEFRAGLSFAPAPPLVPAWMPRLGVALALTSAVVLAARPLDPATTVRTALVTAVRGTAVATEPPSASPALLPDREARPRAARQTLASGATRDGRAAIRRMSTVRSRLQTVPVAAIAVSSLSRAHGGVQAP